MTDKRKEERTNLSPTGLKSLLEFIMNLSRKDVEAVYKISQTMLTMHVKYLGRTDGIQSDGHEKLREVVGSNDH